MAPSDSAADPMTRGGAAREADPLMPSSSAQSCMPDGAGAGGAADADAERFRASARAVVTRAIANWTDAAYGSRADRASADVSAVSHACGYGIDWQSSVTFALDAAEVAAIPETTAASSPFPDVTGTTVARASAVAMAQDHATTGREGLALPNVAIVLVGF